MQMEKRMAKASTARRLLLVGGLALAAQAGPSALAQQEQPSPEQELRELRERVERLEAQADQADAEDIESRLTDLEDQAFDLEDRLGTRPLVRTYDGLELNIGGFITQSLTLAVGSDATEFSPNNTQFELLVSAKPTDKVDIFAALGFLREADLDVVTDPDNPTFMDIANRVPLIIGWGNYRFNDKVQLRAGRFITPHGIINIEHFPPTLLDINQPQFLRPFPGETIFPDFLQGLELHGRTTVPGKDNWDLSYSAYAGVHTSNPNDMRGGGRAQVAFGDSGFTAGANYALGRREAGGGAPGNFSIVGAQSLVSNDYHTLGTELLYDKGRLLWKTELFYSFELDEDDRFAFYTQPAVRIDQAGKWMAFYRFDYLDPGQELGHSIENVLGVNYRPAPNVRFRLAGLIKTFNAGDDTVPAIQGSVTLSF